MSRRAIPYLVTGLISFVAFAIAFKLWRADLHVPFAYANYGDIINTKMSEMLNGGWLFFDPRLAAPFGQNTMSLPELYTVNWAIRWLLVEISRNAFVAENLFDILSPILNSLAFLYAARRFRLSYMAAIPSAVLYGNLFAVYWRTIAGHEFLAAYWLIPLVCLALIQIADGTENATRTDRIVFYGTAALAGLESHYEAFFSTYLVVVGILIGAIQLRSWRPLQLGRAFILTTILAFAVNDVNAILWKLSGHSIAAYPRQSIEAYLYALSPAPMILPIPSHRIPHLAAVRSHFDNIFPQLATENAAATLGTVATIGLFILMIALVMRNDSKMPHVLRHGALFTLAAFALATIGGFGAIFNTFVLPDIRAYNRISPFIAFFALLAIAHVFEWAWNALRKRNLVPLYAAVAAIIMVLGVLDQSPASWAPFAKSKQRVAIDTAWAARIANAVPAKSAILQLPYVSAPEFPILESMYTQVEQVPSLYTRDVRWSVGAVEGTPDASFERWLASLPPRDLVAVALLAGFDGVLVYQQGFADRGGAIESALKAISKQPSLLNDDGTQVFYPLVALAQKAHAAEPNAGTSQGVSDAVAIFNAKGLPESDPHVARIEAVLAKPS
ncbi:MAG TPA: hypothetical protein VGG22_06295 [Candidatus Baltobacteraceae bacterium]|jgi:phosphoglycerol transferase